MSHLNRLQGVSMKICGGILVESKVRAFTFCISNWKKNRVRDGFRFFRNKAASLQARVGRMQAGLEPLMGSTPPETPRWMLSPAASPAGGVSRRRSATHGSTGSLRSDGLRSPSLESDLSDGLSLASPLLRMAAQNEAFARSGRSTPQSTPGVTPLVTPRSP